MTEIHLIILKKPEMIQHRNLCFCISLTMALSLAGGLAVGQVDTIERLGGGRPVRGRIIEVSPTAVVVQAGGTNTTVKAADIRRVSFGAAGGNVRQAISQFHANNFNGCLDTLDRITDQPTNEFLLTELAYCKAMSMGQ